MRKQVLQGTLEVQKCYSGPHARLHFHELKGVVSILQSCKPERFAAVCILEFCSTFKEAISEPNFSGQYYLYRSISFVVSNNFFFSFRKISCFFKII